MKKTFYFAGLTLALAAISCSEIELSISPVLDSMTLKAVSPDTRTSLDGVSVTWSDGDAIAVNGQQSTGVSVSSNGKSAIFTLPVVDAPYYGVYPASSLSANSFDGETKWGTVIVPDVQNYVAGSFDPSAAIMIGKQDVAGEAIVFTHAMAYLKISVTGKEDKDGIKSLVIESLGSESMSGSFTIDEDATTISNESTLGQAVTLNASSAVEQGQPMIVAIPAKTYASGIQITIKDVNGHYQIVKSAKSFTAEAGKIYPTSLEFVPEGTIIEGGIYNVADWTAFAKAVSGGDDFAGKTVKIMNDLKVATYFEYANGTFNGTLDGNSHTMTANGNKWPLFATVGESGTIKNLTVSGSFTSLANPGVAGNAAFAKRNYGLLENCVNNSNTEMTISSGGLVFGTICGQNGGTVKECVNNGDITLTVTTAKDKALYGGGISAAGHILLESVGGGGPVDVNDECPAGKFISCQNHGNITVYDKAGDLPIKAAFGGICGVTFKDGVVFNSCINDGSISKIDCGVNGSNSSSCLGGIVGRAAATNTASSLCVDAKAAANGYNTVIESCSNNGTLCHLVRASGANISVATSESGARKAYTGGIVGLIVGKAASHATVNGCVSTGKIEAGWNGVTSSVPGGIAGCATNTDITDAFLCTEIVSSTNDKSTSSSPRYIAVAGGAAGISFGGLNISGGNYFMKGDFQYGTDNWFGLLIGLNYISGTSIKDVNVGGEIKKKGTLAEITSDNFTSNLFSASSASAPSVSNCIYLAEEPSLP